MRSLFAAVFALGVIAAACTPKVTPQPRAPTSPAPAPAPPASGTPDTLAASSAPEPDVASWVSEWPKSWTDPRVVRGIASRCDFVPVRPHAEPIVDGKESDVFACAVGYEQACVPDPCLSYRFQCENGCENTCQTCGSTCAATCNSCKASCKDDACKKQCATGCAECRQSCNRTLDRCATGECGKARDACFSRLQKVWRANGCGPKCATFDRCQKACDKRSDSDACRDQCEKKASATFAPCQERCMTLGGAGDTQGICLVSCLETSPCSSFMCMLGSLGLQ